MANPELGSNRNPYEAMFKRVNLKDFVKAFHNSTLKLMGSRFSFSSWKIEKLMQIICAISLKFLTSPFLFLSNFLCWIQQIQVSPPWSKTFFQSFPWVHLHLEASKSIVWLLFLVHIVFSNGGFLELWSEWSSRPPCLNKVGGHLHPDQSHLDWCQFSLLILE